MLRSVLTALICYEIVITILHLILALINHEARVLKRDAVSVAALRERTGSQPAANRGI